MTHSYFIQKTLGIKDKNITFEKQLTEERIKDQNHLVLYAKLTYCPEACINCGVVNHSSDDIVKNGTKLSTIKLTHINFKPVLLKLKKQRFFCKHCLATFIAQTKLVERNCYISNLIKSTISMELAETQSMALIAKHLNISSHTVMRQLKKYGASIKANYHYLPQHISLDEFKSVNNVSGAMSLIFIDARTHQVMDIVENRQQLYLKNYFFRYSLKARLQVKTVTMDMYSPYIQVVKDCFPNARMIIDRFHLVQLLNRSLNQVRIQEMKKIRYTRPRDYRKLKKQWKLILKNESDLDYEKYFTHRLYEGMVSEYIMLEYLLSISPKLAKAYRVVNRLKWALKNRRFKRFKEELKKAKQDTYPQQVRTALNTLEKYIKPIKNAFLYTLSNGPIEGINNKVKNIKPSGYGYRNFRNLKNRILISFNLVMPSEEPKPLFYTNRKVNKPSKSITVSLRAVERIFSRSDKDEMRIMGPRRKDHEVFEA